MLVTQNILEPATQRVKILGRFLLKFEKQTSNNQKCRK